MTTRVTLIAAVSDDGFISQGAGIPWHLPTDIAHFRAHTADRWLLLGRRTYEEMRGWFRPGHQPLVLSREAGFVPEVGACVHSVTEALALADGELMVCGGGQIYAAAMPVATRLMITRVHTRLHNGVAFPVIDPTQWREVRREEHAADATHALALTFLDYERVTGSPDSPRA